MTEKLEQLKTAVFETIGTASMCWSETPKGIFDSILSKKIGEELWDKIIAVIPDEEKTSMGFFNDYAIANNKMHPIAKLFYDAMQECEQMPASEQQTKTVIAISKCRDAIEQELSRLKS